MSTKTLHNKHIIKQIVFCLMLINLPHQLPANWLSLSRLGWARHQPQPRSQGQVGAGMHLPRGDSQGIKLVLRMPPQARTICCQPDRGARWAIFHSVTKSRTRLSMRARRLPCSLYIQGASCGRSKGFTPKTSWLRDDRKKLWETTLPLTPRPAKEDACFWEGSCGQGGIWFGGEFEG